MIGFTEKYREFYIDIYAFHKKYYDANSFDAIGIDLAEMANKYPQCKDFIVATFNRIEADFVGRKTKELRDRET